MYSLKMKGLDMRFWSYCTALFANVKYVLLTLPLPFESKMFKFPLIPENTAPHLYVHSNPGFHF